MIIYELKKLIKHDLISPFREYILHIYTGCMLLRVISILDVCYLFHSQGHVKISEKEN